MDDNLAQRYFLTRRLILTLVMKNDKAVYDKNLFKIRVERSAVNILLEQDILMKIYIRAPTTIDMAQISSPWPNMRMSLVIGNLAYIYRWMKITYFVEKNTST